MDASEVRAAFGRAAEKAGAAGAGSAGEAGPGPPAAPVLYGAVPTFAEAPRASSAAELEGAGAAVLGIPLEGVRRIDPVTQSPPAAAAAPDGSAYFRTGTEEGPAAIRRQSVFYSLRHGRGFMPDVDRDLVILDRLSLVDYGDVAVAPGDPEGTFLCAHDKLADILAAGAVPIVLGGDHSVSIPVLQVLSGKLNGRLGMVVFDSHLDMCYEPKYWAGSQWARAFELGVVEPEHFVQIGIRGGGDTLAEKAAAEELGYRYFTMGEVDELGITAVMDEAREISGSGTETTYVSLDVDVVDPAHGGQRRPDPAGLSARELVRALREVASGPLAGFDVCGLAPRYDLEGHLAQLAARAVMEVVAGLALQRPQ